MQSLIDVPHVAQLLVRLHNWHTLLASLAKYSEGQVYTQSLPSTLR